MHDKAIGYATLVASVLMALGCQESNPAESEIVERMASDAPTLTATASPVSPPQIEQAKVELALEGSTAAQQPDRPLMPTLESHDGLTIERLVMASAIEDREPALASSIFGNGEDKIYAFIEASNSSQSDQTLMVHFIGPGGEVSGGIDLEVPASAPRWRTWAYTRHAKAPGIWRVEIRNPEGVLLGVLPFEVKPDC
ncbi:MAG: DUF2914 domain-containing protein [Polyangiales bacterium]